VEVVVQRYVASAPKVAAGIIPLPSHVRPPAALKPLPGDPRKGILPQPLQPILAQAQYGTSWRQNMRASIGSTPVLFIIRVVDGDEEHVDISIWRRGTRTWCSGLSGSKGTCTRVCRSFQRDSWVLLSCTDGRSCGGSSGPRQLLIVAESAHTLFHNSGHSCGHVMQCQRDGHPVAGSAHCVT
jgi:hypothetical protein